MIIDFTFRHSWYQYRSYDTLDYWFLIVCRIHMLSALYFVIVLQVTGDNSFLRVSYKWKSDIGKLPAGQAIRHLSHYTGLLWNLYATSNYSNLLPCLMSSRSILFLISWELYHCNRKIPFFNNQWCLSAILAVTFQP